MKILIISGFLGAGKTTFIRALSANTGKETAVLENEYGGAGIDGEILTKDTDAGEINIWEMTEGCICCSMKGDFAASVLTIANSVDPDYLIIEPTGVAYLGRILENLRQIEYERIQLLSPVTIVDGHSFLRYKNEYPELYADQVSAAGTIFVSKMEQAPAEEKDVLRESLQKMNPDAHIVTEHYSSMERDGWLRILEQGGGDICKTSDSRDTAGMEEMPDTFSITNATMRRPEELFVMLENLVHGVYGDIFRAKGVVCAQGYNYRFDVADGLYCVTGADSETDASVVFIGRDIKRQALRKMFFNIINGGKFRRMLI